MSALKSILACRDWVNHSIVGQPHLVDRLFIALLADGHLLVEGAPGLAKTKAIKTLSEGIEASFHRVQFTPDLLPSDVTGTDIYRPETATFDFQKGPIFHNLVLADEINRAPAKVQSSLLEAMAERQVSVGRNTYELPELFLVMATQNPIEQEGTYPLPEAQLDRFLMHVLVDYPSAEAEKTILRLARQEAQSDIPPAPEPISQETLLQARQDILKIYLAEPVEDYLVSLTQATRQPAAVDSELAEWIDFGVSPRGTIALERTARTHAWLNGRDYVNPEDVQAILHDVFRHRVLLSFEAQANGVTPNRVIDRLLETVAVA